MTGKAHVADHPVRDAEPERDLVAAEWIGTLDHDIRVVELAAVTRALVVIHDHVAVQVVQRHVRLCRRSAVP